MWHLSEPAAAGTGSGCPPPPRRARPGSAFPGRPGPGSRCHCARRAGEPDPMVIWLASGRPGSEAGPARARVRRSYGGH